MLDFKTKKRIPYLCTPIIGSTLEALLEEITEIKLKNPDMIEWRADYFHALHDFDTVAEVANTIKSQIGDIALLFTVRSEAEGGQPITLSPHKLLDLLSVVSSKSSIDIIDYELQNEEQHIKNIREITRKHDKKMLLSYHNFEFTPNQDTLRSLFHHAETLGADIAKMAIMPNSKQDVLTLLSLTNEMNETLTIPVATMSLSTLGSVSRAMGWIFGSSLIFTVGQHSSAPGQIPIEEIREIINILQKHQPSIK